jgi:uncharacterized membrane protein
MKICRIISTVFALSFFLLEANAAFAGLGVSPSQMVVQNLSKGSHAEETFILSRSDPKEDLHFKVIAEGATKDWTTLDRGMEFTMPAGEQRFPVIVKVDIPKDAANGEYKGLIRLASSSKSSKGMVGSGTSVALSVLIQTDLTITGEQVLKYDVSSIGIQNIEEGSPLDVLVTINNTGNVEAHPTKVHVEVFDKLNTELLESQDIAEMGSVAPFTTGDIAISIPTKLGIGQYWARISAYKDEALLKKQDLVFEIVPLGSLKKKGNLKNLIFNQKAGVGETVKITGVFENTGESNYSAKLVAEIYKNEKMIKAVESDLANMKSGKTENLSAYFTPDVAGKYTAKVHVAYSGEKTQEKQAIISVGGAGLFSLASVIIISLLILIVAVIILAVYFKKKTKK